MKLDVLRYRLSQSLWATVPKKVVQNEKLPKGHSIEANKNKYSEKGANNLTNLASQEGKKNNNKKSRAACCKRNKRLSADFSSLWAVLFLFFSFFLFSLFCCCCCWLRALLTSDARKAQEESKNMVKMSQAHVFTAIHLMTQ